jgi:hypothetical protein
VIILAGAFFAVTRYQKAHAAPVRASNCGSWTIVSSPSPNTNLNILYSVSAISANDVWAVGELNFGFSSATLIEHWDGSAWSVVPSPSPNSVINELVAATNVSAKDVWAVGNDGGEHLLIEQWNGSQWNVKQSAKGLTGFLNGTVAVSGHNVWAVGIGSNGSQAAQAISEQWNGAKWSSVTMPNPGTHSILRGVTVIPGTSSLWSVGDYETDGSSSSNTLTEFYQSCS